MNAVRLTYEKPPKEISVPAEFLSKPLEVIIMALEHKDPSGKKWGAVRTQTGWLKLRQEPVSWQRSIRSEWDRPA